MKTPSFWYQTPGFISKVLAPASAFYDAAGKMRQHLTHPRSLQKPVICVGNLVAGGAGKTPVTIALARHLKESGYSPHILSRGYGSNALKPILVDNNKHQYIDVGDEPLLLSSKAPTWVCKNRFLTANLAIEHEATHLILDDGFQNPNIQKDIALLVIDGIQGFGNGKVIPAGPLREKTSSGLIRADAIVLIGKDHHQITQLANYFDKPLINAEIVPINANPRKVIAFAGLGYPFKFYNMLNNLGYEISDQLTFPDHHPYSSHDIEQLIDNANNHKADLITTNKDLIRIDSKYHKYIDTLDIELKFSNLETLDNILEPIL